MATRALYYPYFRVRRDAWLVRAALVWRQVYRVLPSDYVPDDSEVSRRLTDEGILLRVDAETEAADFQETFLQVLADEPDAFRDYELADVFLELHHLGWAYDDPPSQGPGGYHDTRPGHLAWVHAAQFGGDIAETLFEQRLGVGAGAWIGVWPEFADMYTSALAGHVARRNGWDPITGDATAFASAVLPAVDMSLTPRSPESARQPAMHEAAERALALATLDLVVPSDAEIDVETLLTIRRDWAGEYDAFAKRLADLAPRLERELVDVTSRAAARDIVADVCDQEIGADLRRLREALEWHNVEAVTKTIGIPVGVSSLLVGGPFIAVGIPVIGTVAAAAVGVASIIATLTHNRRAARHASAAGYLLGIEGALARPRSIDREHVRHTCPICGKACAGPSGLEQHYKTKHSG